MTTTYLISLAILIAVGVFLWKAFRKTGSPRAGKEDVGSMMVSALELAGSGSYLKAIDKLNRIIARYPNAVEPLLLRANSLLALEQGVMAMPDFDLAILLAPERDDALTYRGGANLAMENYQEAIEDFSEVIRLSPEDTNAWKCRGDGYMFLDQFKEAIPNYDKAIELDPKLAEAYSHRGMCRNNLGDRKAGIVDSAVCDISAAIIGLTSPRKPSI